MSGNRPDISADAKRQPPGNLSPADQLLAIFAVNVIMLIWVAVSFSRFYDKPPNLPGWIYWAEAFVLLASGPLSLFDAWWPRLRKIAEDRDSTPNTVEVDIRLLKVMVFALTVLDIVVLWQLAEGTGGVMSPYAPFLPAPAIFAAFVTRRWQTIVALSLAVAVAIAFSSLHLPHPVADLAAYQGSAAVMVILAGLLSALRALVAGTGEPITAQWSAVGDEARPGPPPERKIDDDDDLSPSTA